MVYNFQEIDDYRLYMPKAELHKAINSLIGLINGVEIDDIVNSDEISEIINWCNLHRHLQKKSPFSEIIPMIDEALMDNKLESNEIQDILWLCNHIINSSDFKEYYDSITASIQQLESLIHGVLSDNTLSNIEINRLITWMNDHEFLKGTYPFDEINSLLVSVTQDKIITPDERNMLIAFFGNFVDTKISYNINEFEIKELQSKYSINGICAVNPEINFKDKTFCFTGTSSRASRNEIAKTINDKGGIFNNNIVKKTEYLIIGGEGNPCWAFSCYGRKVEKAMKLRTEGAKITIIHENDFWDEIY